MNYRAFLSYSHKDADWARWLHRSLERYKIERDLVGRMTPHGPVPRNLRPIFRDRDDFSAGNTLAEQTLAALDASAAVIVLCSPHAACSRYVNEEIRLARWTQPTRQVIPVILDGQPDECFPPALKYKIDSRGEVTSEPEPSLLGADLRPSRDGKELALAKIVSGLLDVPLDEIIHRAEREHRRRLRAWVAGLATVAVTLAGLAFWAEINRRTAERAIASANTAAGELIDDVAHRFEDTAGVPLALVTAVLEKAAELVDRLSSSGSPDSSVERTLAVALGELSTKQWHQGELDRAQETARRAVSTFERILAAVPKDRSRQVDLMWALDRLGDALAQGKRTDEALAAYGRGLQMARKLVAAGSDADSQRKLAGMLEKHASAVLRLDSETALREYDESLAIRRQLALDDPSAKGLKSEISISLDGSAATLLQAGQRGEALKRYRESVNLAKEVAKAESGNTAEADLAAAHQHLGLALLHRGEAGPPPDSVVLEEASTAFKTSLDIMQRLIGLDGTNVLWRLEIIKTIAGCGDALFALKKDDEAIERYKQGLDIARRLAIDQPTKADWRAVFAFFQKIGKVLYSTKRSAEALTWARSSVVVFREAAARDAAQSGRLPAALSNLAWVAVLAGHYNTALEAIDEAIKLATPDRLLAYRVNKIHALAMAGDAEGARTLYLSSRALEGGSKLDGLIKNDLEEFREVGLGDEVIARVAVLVDQVRDKRLDVIKDGAVEVRQ